MSHDMHQAYEIIKRISQFVHISSEGMVRIQQESSR